MDSAALYRLMSWLSPSFPVGAYAYSHGLEYAVEAGHVSDRVSAIGWIEAVMVAGTGRADAVLLREAYEAVTAENWSRLEEVRAFGVAFQPSREIALEARAQGAAFASTLRRIAPSSVTARLTPEVTYPVVLGAAAAAERLPLGETLTSYAHALAANLVSAAVRLIPLGQTDGQRAIDALRPAVLSAVEASREMTLDDIGTATPMVDWASMRHEKQRTRLFRS